MDQTGEIPPTPNLEQDKEIARDALFTALNDLLSSKKISTDEAERLFSNLAEGINRATPVQDHKAWYDNTNNITTITEKLKNEA